MLAAASAFAVAIRWAMTHTHSQRLLALEGKAADIDAKLSGVAATVQVIGPSVVKQIAPVIEAADPKVESQVAVYNKQIAEVQSAITALTAKINSIATAIPKS
jgi:hypothetical protein